MTATIYTILRYGHGEVGLTGWGAFWLLVAAVYASSTSTTRIVRDRANRRAERTREASPDDDQEAS